MRISRLKNLEIQHLWAVTVILGVFVFVNTQPIRPNDFWWHMAIGREISASRSIPVVDEYSHTMAGEPYPSYQMFWLPEVVMYQVYELGGPALIIFLQSVIITSAYAILLYLCWRISNSLRIASMATLFAIGMGIFNWTVRPQTISYLIGVLFLLAIFSYRQNQKYRWLLVFPLGMIVWVNSHGSFLIGLALIGIWLADEVWNIIAAKYSKQPDVPKQGLWTAMISLAATTLVCVINPRGIGIVSYVLDLTGNPVVQNLVPEWAPPSFDTDYGTVYLIGLLLCSVVLAISEKRPNFFQLVSFLMFGILGLMTTRGVIWFGIVMAPVLADHIPSVLSRFIQPRSERSTGVSKTGINRVILALLIMITIISLPWLKKYLPFPQSKRGLIYHETPIEATQFLISERLPGKLFHDMGYGSYLIWAAYPDYRVFTDPRIELYPLETWRDYTAIGNALPGWENQLDRYGIYTLMVSPENQAPLVAALGGSPGWSLKYEDPAALIYTRNDP